MKTNDYPNWLVSVEQAKRLKEIGFDEYCVFYTRVLKKGETSNYIISVCHDTYDKIIPGIRNKDHIDTDNTFGISLPIFEQIFEWFRNKGFRISLENHEDSTKFMFYNMKINEGKHFKGEFSNYEKAREALLNKLIEIYDRQKIEKI